jgi:N-acetylglucosamine-6-phosphate deacetylase
VKLDVAAALIDGRLVPGQIEIVDGRIARYGLAPSNGRVRGIAVPGFVDLQVNGFAGVDFLETDADGYRVAGEALLETGVTSFLPTFITAEEEDVLAALAEIPPSSGGPRILGVHLEGPFLAASRLGTHPPAGRRDPDVALLERLLAAGPVRMMTLAPELPDALGLIDVLSAHGVVVSCGHSDATAEQADVAFDRGARTVTHLFNAMRPLTHRDPGIVGAALVRDDVVVQIIVDGIHLAPATTALVWRAAAGRVALVTDAVAAASASGGSYSLGSVELSVRDGAVRAPDGMLAGSVLTMIEAVRNLHALGAPLESALDAASAVPARVLGLTEAGRLDIGMPADLVVLDDNLEIESVFVGGEERVVA